VCSLDKIINCPLVIYVSNFFKQRFVILVSELWPGHHEFEAGKSGAPLYLFLDEGGCCEGLVEG
jgi:hypothetical protein